MELSPLNRWGSMRAARLSAWALKNPIVLSNLSKKTKNLKFFVDNRKREVLTGLPFFF